MKKNIFISKVIKGINVLALMLVVLTANSACIWVAHQPTFPEAGNKYKLMK